MGPTGAYICPGHTEWPLCRDSLCASESAQEAGLTARSCSVEDGPKDAES